jgi:GNAT superfamily N-acetyltransferase
MAQIVNMNFDKPAAKAAVMRAVIESAIAMPYAGDEDADVRLLMWTDRQGQWVAAVEDNQVAGVAVATVADGTAELVWVEVAEGFRGRGIGEQLLGWARGLADRFTVKATESAVAFYVRQLGVEPNADRVFVVEA